MIDLTPIPSNAVKLLLGKGRSMPRDRHQRGRVEETGKRVRKWKGHYFVYSRQPDGSEKRAHRAVMLGLKSQMKKWEAEKKLAVIIDTETGTAIPKPSGDVTLQWFWENRFRPIKESKWKQSSRNETIKNIERYVIAGLGEIPLGLIDKFRLQTHVNELAKKFGKSVVEKAFIWSRAILDEAVDQGFIEKNPGKKLEMPETRKVNRKTVDVQAIATAFAKLAMRERLMLRIALVLGLRPGEILALRWDDVFESSLRIDEGAVDGKIYDPKTEGSIAHVWMTPEIKAEIEFWRSVCGDPALDAFIFPNTRGQAMHLDNYRKRLLNPALDAAGLKGVTLQQCRRTCGTVMLNGKHGNLKDVQGHLRHAQASTTLGIYIQSIPESVRSAVESLDRTIFGAVPASSAENAPVN